MSFEEQLREEKAKEQQLQEEVRILEVQLATVQATLLRQQGAVQMLEKITANTIGGSGRFCSCCLEVPQYRTTVEQSVAPNKIWNLDAML